MHAIDVITVVSFLIPVLTSFSRLFIASRAFWAKLPPFVQVWLPPIIPALTALVSSLAGVKTWTDFGVALFGAVALALPGLPSNRSAAPLQPSKASDIGTPSQGDKVVAASIAPPPVDVDDEYDVKIPTIKLPPKIF